MTVERDGRESAESGNLDAHEGAGAILWPIGIAALLGAGWVLLQAAPVFIKVMEALP